MTAQSVITGIVALMVIGFLGTFVLLYPHEPNSYLALGALIAIAGGIGPFFFHLSTQNFLGTQLAAQRAVTVAALTQPTPTSGISSTGSIASLTPTSTPTTPTPAGSNG